MNNNKKVKYICGGIAVLSALYSAPVNSVYADGWDDDNGGKIYIEDSHKVIGWKFLKEEYSDKEHWYYFDNNGHVKTGWLKYQNKWYYFNEDGKMAKNCSVDGYALGNDGYWIEDGGWKRNSTGWWYSYGASKGYAIGWKAFEDIDRVKHDEYYLNKGDIWYYFDENGYMKTGWFNYEGKWYYFNNDGSMARNSTIDGYIIGDDGVWIEKLGKVTDNSDLITKPEKSSYPLWTTEIKYYIINNTGMIIKTMYGPDFVEKCENGEWKLMTNKVLESVKDMEEAGGCIADLDLDIYKVYENKIMLNDFKEFDSSKPGKYRVIFHAGAASTTYFEEFEIK